MWPLTSPYLDDLRNSLLYDPNKIVQKTAAEVLGQIEVNDPSTVEALYLVINTSSSGKDLLDTAERALTNVLARIDIASEISEYVEGRITPEQHIPTSESVPSDVPQQSPWIFVLKLIKNIIKIRVTNFFNRLLGRGVPRPRRKTTLLFRMKLINWLSITEARDARKFLENHLELLRPESESLLATAPIIIRHLPKENASSLARMVKVNKVIVQRAMTMGKTIQAVRDAYIDEFNALTVLDIPSWLSVMNARIMTMILLFSINDTTSTGVQKLEADLQTLLQEAIAKVQSASGLEPEILANLQLMLGLYLTEENSSRAIEMLTNAATIFVMQRFPHKFAQIQRLLGQSYFNKFMESDDEEDIFMAILCFEASLTYFTPQKDMEEWAQQMTHLCRCYGFMKDYELAQQILNEVTSKLSSSLFSELAQATQEMRNQLESFLQDLQEQEDWINWLELEPGVPEVAMKIRNEFREELEEQRARLHAMRLARASDLQANMR